MKIPTLYMRVATPKYTIGQTAYLINADCIRGANDHYTAYANHKTVTIRESCTTVVTNEHGRHVHTYYITDDDSIDEKYLCATEEEAMLESLARADLLNRTIDHLDPGD